MLWKRKIVDNDWLWIYCPVMDKPGKMSFGLVRKIVRELKDIEKEIENTGLASGWIAYTNIVHSHIIRLLAKLGANPYKVNIKENNIWFKKLIIAR